MERIASPLQDAAPRLFRASSEDGWLVACALAQGALGVALAAMFPSLWEAGGAGAALSLVAAGAMGLWWGSNTISHIHLHAPLFASRALNRAFSLYLTMVLGVPQSIWRARHLWHHAGEPAPGARIPWRTASVELLLVGAAWTLLLATRPVFFLGVYLPAYAFGLLLCQAQGHFEHAGAGAGGISFYSHFYNRLWFNDGYHAEHHRHPTEHWTRLPSRKLASCARSDYPPVLRFVESGAPRALVWLERLALAWPALARFMLATHERAFRAVLPVLVERGPIRRACVVGGGLLPRTAIVLARVIPDCTITVLDSSAEHLSRARSHELSAALADRVSWVAGTLDLDASRGFDLVVVPLGLVGDREAVYEAAARPGAPCFVVHDWIWRRRGRAGVVISWLLFKRLNVA